MASSDNSSRNDSSVADERGNPFVTFSRLVDQQMSSLFRNMFNFPATPRENPDRPYYSPASAGEQRRWQEEAKDFEKSLNEFFEQHNEDRQDEEEARRRAEERMADLLVRQSLQDDPHYRQHSTDKGRDEAWRTLNCVRDAYHHADSNDDSEAVPQRCPYEPQLRYPYGHERVGVSEEPSAAHGWSKMPFWSRAPVPWLFDNTAESPRSPPQRQDQQASYEHGPEWRRAFGDLLAAQHGVDAPYERHREETSKESRLPALPFYLANQQDLLSGNATNGPENDAEEDAPTELDLYKHFLRAGSPHSTSVTSAQPSSISAGAHDPPGQLNVISVMTTTQRTTSPDGSIYTQVVLKKRFSDGTEESTETEHTTAGTKGRNESTIQTSRPRHEYAAKPTPALGYDGKVKQTIEQRLEEKKKTGWFWS
ncbi:MAG: hypothetical protein Q9168_002819 [Polycauliona sp. 1 TL-2023]